MGRRVVRFVVSGAIAAVMQTLLAFYLPDDWPRISIILAGFAAGVIWSDAVYEPMDRWAKSNLRVGE